MHCKRDNFAEIPSASNYGLVAVAFVPLLQCVPQAVIMALTLDL